MTERRAVPRVEPSAPLAARVKTSLAARVVDISCRGAQVEVWSPLKPQASCDFRVELGDGELALRANVRHCHVWGFGENDKSQRVLVYRAGLEFVDVSPETLARLRAAVIEPTASGAAEPAGRRVDAFAALFPAGPVPGQRAHEEAPPATIETVADDDAPVPLSEPGRR